MRISGSTDFDPTYTAMTSYTEPPAPPPQEEVAPPSNVNNPIIDAALEKVYNELPFGDIESGLEILYEILGKKHLLTAWEQAQLHFMCADLLFSYFPTNRMGEVIENIREYIYYVCEVYKEDPERVFIGYAYFYQAITYLYEGNREQAILDLITGFHYGEPAAGLLLKIMGALPPASVEENCWVQTLPLYEQRRVYFGKGLYAKAMEASENYTATLPEGLDRPLYFIFKGSCYAMLEQYSEALSSFAMALSNLENFSPGIAMIDYALIKYLSGDSIGAQEVLKSIENNKENNYTCTDILTARAIIPLLV